MTEIEYCLVANVARMQVAIDALTAMVFPDSESREKHDEIVKQLSRLAQDTHAHILGLTDTPTEDSQWPAEPARQKETERQ